VDYKLNNKAKSPIKFFTATIEEFRNRESFLSNIHNWKQLIFGNYNVFIKVRHDKNLYKMAGFQFGLSYLSKDSLNVFYDSVENRLDDLFSKYSIQRESIDFIAIYFVSVSITLLENFKLPPVDPSLDSGLDSKGNITSQLEEEARMDTIALFKKVPVSGALDKIVPKIQVTVVDGYIKNIPVDINNNTVNLLGNILQQNKFSCLRRTKGMSIGVFEEDWNFYLVGSGRQTHVLGLRKVSDTEKIMVRYSLNGSLLDYIIDKLQDDNTVIREQGNYKYHFDAYHNILRNEYNNFNYVENPNIGVVDTETIVCKDGITRVYCLGFKTNLDESPILFYVNDDKDLESYSNLESNSDYSKYIKYLKYDKVVLELVEGLLASKYKNVKFYCHNMAKLDVYFLLGVLLRHNRHASDYSPKYKLSYVLRDKDILKLTVRKKIHDIIYKFTIQDSYLMLTQSQAKLCEVFKVDSLKGVFPYKFLHEHNLSYVGQTPGVTFYKGLDDNSPEYKALLKQDWSFKEESLKYLANDLNGLHQVLVKFSKHVFRTHKVDITDSLTIASMAMDIFHNKYYKDNIPLVQKASLYKDIKKGYYGGMTEVYKPYGKNLFYYDVNSLYPFVALQDMPGITCNKIEFLDRDINHHKLLDTLFGFYYVDVDCSNTPDRYLGLLPYRDGKTLIFPTGKWRGWYFSEELKFAVEYGYNITLLKGYTFNRVSGVFSDYVNDLYSLKVNAANSVEKAVSKSLLNNLLGRFGIDIHKPIADIVSLERFRELSSLHKIYGYEELDDNRYLISYTAPLDWDIINANGLDIAKIAAVKKDREGSTQSSTSVPISACINAYGRIHINIIKLGILNSGGKIYYSDTDSIVTDLKLGDDLISPTEIGKLKLEHEISRAIFISGKSYCLETKDGKLVTKYKGVNSDLTWDSYSTLLNLIDIKASKTQVNRDFMTGSVTIGNTTINLNHDSYTGRLKTFKDGDWDDTKPIVIHLEYNPFFKVNKEDIDKLKKSKADVVTQRQGLKGILALVLLYTFITVSWLATNLDEEEAAADLRDVSEEPSPDIFDLTSSKSHEDSKDFKLFKSPINGTDFHKLPLDEFRYKQTKVFDLLTGGGSKENDVPKEKEVLTVDTSKRSDSVADDIFTPFTPNSLLELNKEIQIIEDNFEAIHKLPLIDEVKEAHVDRMQSSLTYYYQQLYTHENSVLHQAINTSLNDEDMDKTRKDLNLLKSKVGKLLRELNHSHRRLE
jgi:hypothetical protein